MLKVLNYINVSRGTNMSNMLGLWLRHSPTPCGSSVCVLGSFGANMLHLGNRIRETNMLVHVGTMAAP